MNRQESAFYVIIVFVIITLLWVYYFRKKDFELKCIVANKDGNTYCVRDKKNMEQSAELLAEATNRMITLVSHLQTSFPENDAIQRLVAGFDPKKISETLPNSKLVAYTENKNKMMFCLTEEKQSESQLIDINTLMFVAIHELSHIASKTIGHKQEFWDNFKMFLIESEKIGVYTPEDYKQKPREFCGMKIKDNPYYDL